MWVELFLMEDGKPVQVVIISLLTLHNHHDGFYSSRVVSPISPTINNVDEIDFQHAYWGIGQREGVPKGWELGCPSNGHRP